MIAFLLQAAWETWIIVREVSFFLLFGFGVAGVLAVLVPSRLFMRFLGTGRIKSVLWASVIGIPVPLCSCGVLPTSLGLSKQGATKGATVSFLIATPETGIDSIAMSYALMDPIITIFRPIAGIVTAIAAGLATNRWGTKRARPAAAPGGAEVGTPGPSDAGAAHPEAHLHHDEADVAAAPGGRLLRARQVLAYGFRELLDETAHWLVLGIVLSAVVAVLLPPSLIERYLGGGLATMVAMFLLGIPIYTCASASTPIAAALVLKGLSPGAALVFLLSGPATNLGAVVVLLKFLGRRVMLIYLTAVAVLSVLAGFALDWIYRWWQVNPAATYGRAADFIPDSVNVTAALVLIGLLAVSVWRTPVPDEWLWVRNCAARLTGMRVTAARLRLATAAAVAALYVGSGFFTVQVGEVAIKTRFGRVVDGHLGPGPHYRLPWPLEAERVIQRDRIRRLEVGFRTAPTPPKVESPLVMPAGGHPGFWYQRERVTNESFLLTGDENIIDVAFTAQYRVQDPLAFAYNVADPDALVRDATISVLRATVATMPVDAVLTTERDRVEGRVVRAAQALLDSYHAGVRLVSVNLLSVDAPEEVHAAFRDVASAQEDKILIINRAETFAEEAVNLAQGDAAAMIAAAQAYKEQKILQAEGDARAFSLREDEYRRSPDLTRFRLSLEALEEILPGIQKVLRPGAADVKDFDLWLLQPFGARKGQ